MSKRIIPNRVKSVIFKHLKLSLLIVLVSLNVSAQVGGEQVYTFLNFPTSARQTALGGSVLTLTDDVNQPLWNPSAINEDLDSKMSVNYVNYLAEINFFSASYAYNVDRHIGTIHTGLTYLNYGSFIAADESGNETGTFNAFDMAFSVGYAYQIPRTSFYIGANAKIINSVIEKYSSFGLAADVGIMYHNYDKPYRFSAVIRNAGAQITNYTDVQEPIPFQILVGGSFQPEHVPIRIYGTLDNLQRWNLAQTNPSDSTSDFEGNVLENNPSFLNNLMRHVVVGAELFPDKGFSLRTGFNFQRAQELSLKNIRTFAGLNFGFGLKMKRFKLNYAFSKYHPVADTHSFSLEIYLNQ
ncbi:MAG TPA: type IX secretion system protein PorQ [Lutibacter sp.]|nr:type IX secretion system protein PorQ [Lutibacter sp.]